MSRPVPPAASSDRRVLEGAGGWLAVVGSLAVAWALAVAQPVLDLLAREPAFLAAHRSQPADVLVLALVFSLGLPLVGGAGVLAVARVAPRAAAVLHAGLLGVLGAAFAVQLLRGSVPAAVVLAAAALAGAALIVAYRRVPAVRSVLSVGAVVPALVAGLFLASAPIASGEEALAADAGVRVTDPAPVVVVVLDELPVTTLLGPDGAIDADRFPGFARLARSSTWYRNAATPDDHTHRVIPALLSGQPAREGRAPVASEHPHNLFTWLADSHDVIARERVTWLCPPSVCPVSPVPVGRRLSSLARDVGVVTGHVVLPDPLREELPPLDTGWSGFGADATSPTRAPDGAADLSFATFLDSFASGGTAHGRPLLRYYHVMGPHHPFRSLPDGTVYPQDLPMPAYDDGPPDPADEPYVTQAHQRHLLQAGAVDGLVVDLLDALEAWPAYDDALVAVLADHGVSFRTGESLRLAREGNIDELAYVPLFVKAPGQTRGRVDDRPALVTDLAATVVDALGVEGVPPPQGASLLAEGWDPQRRRVLHSRLGSEHVLRPDGAERATALAQQTRRFPVAGWDAVWTPGPHDDLVGRRVADLVVGTPERATVELRDLPLGEPPPLPSDASGEVVAVLVDGRVQGDTVGAGDWLAVALDGRVAATALVHDREAGPGRFTAVVRPAPGGADPGAAEPVLYLVDSDGPTTRLRRVGP